MGLAVLEQFNHSSLNLSLANLIARPAVQLRRPRRLLRRSDWQIAGRSGAIHLVAWAEFAKFQL